MDKEIKAIKVIRNKEDKMWEKAVWCKEHNFPLEEQKFRHTENVLRNLANEIQEVLETGYVKGDS